MDRALALPEWNIYVDGVLQSKVALDNWSQNQTGNFIDHKISIYNTDFLSDIRIYKKILTQTEVTNIFNRSL